MSTSQLDLNYDPDRLAEICRHYHVAKLEVFGSHALGDARPDSDVDLLVSFAEGYTPGLEFVALAEDLEALLGRSIDLLVREDAELDRNPIRRQAIFRAVEPMYAAG